MLINWKVDVKEEKSADSDLRSFSFPDQTVSNTEHISTPSSCPASPTSSVSTSELSSDQNVTENIMKTGINTQNSPNIVTGSGEIQNDERQADNEKGNSSTSISDSIHGEMANEGVLCTNEAKIDKTLKICPREVSSRETGNNIDRDEAQKISFKDALVAKLEAELKRDEDYLKLINKRKPQKSHSGTQTPQKVCEFANLAEPCQINVHEKDLKQPKTSQRDMIEYMSECLNFSPKFSESENSKSSLSHATSYDDLSASSSINTEIVNPLTSTLSPLPQYCDHDPITSAPLKSERRKKKEKSKRSKLKWRMLSPVGKEYIYVTKQVLRMSDPVNQRLIRIT